MKKIYNSPKINNEILELESLLQSYSNAEADSKAVTLSRDGGGSFWDDAE